MTAPVHVTLGGLLSEKALSTLRARGALVGLCVEQFDDGTFWVARPDWGRGAALSLATVEQVEGLIARMQGVRPRGGNT